MHIDIAPPFYRKAAYIFLYLAFFTQHFDLEMTSHQYIETPFIPFHRGPSNTLRRSRNSVYSVSPPVNGPLACFQVFAITNYAFMGRPEMPFCTFTSVHLWEMQYNILRRGTAESEVKYIFNSDRH